MLWISELEEAFKSAFGRQKVALLLMCNCYMQTFDIGWVLRKRVKYLVAPEGIFQAHGYSYQGILSNINANTKISVSQLVKTIKPDFIDKWKKLVKGELELSRVTVVITKPGKYQLTQILFNVISMILNNLSKYDVSRIIATRQEKIFNATNDPTEKAPMTFKIDMIDLSYFLRYIQKLLPRHYLLNFLIWLFLKSKKKVLEDLYIGEAYKKFDNSKEQPRKFGIEGISIFFPHSIETSNLTDIANCAYFGKPKMGFLNDANPSDEFLEGSSWNKFLRKVIEILYENNPH
jgi:hypothetical protein